VACYTLPHKVVVRAKMILYAAEGQSNAEIARRLETAAEVVGRWRKRFFEERLAGLKDRQRARRPRRFPPYMNPMKKGLRLAGETPAGHLGRRPNGVVRRIGSQSQASRLARARC